MQEVVRETRESFGHTYAEPLSGLRVSWGAVLAGAVTTLAVSLLLWALALAVIALATHPEAGSLRGGAIALWVCAMGTTLIGALFGGWFAGYLPGNPRSGVGAVHGFLAWAVALIVTFAFQFAMLRGAALAATNAMTESGMLESAPPGAAPGQGNMQGGQGGTDLGQQPTQQQQMANVGHDAINTVVGVSWSWFGTWAVALVLATAAGAAAASTRFRGAPPAANTTTLREEHNRRFGPPLTPAPTA